MKKRIFTFFLMLVAGVVTLFASDTQVDGIWYKFNSSAGTAIVTYRGDYYSSFSNEYTGYVVIPASVTYSGKTYSVTSIGSAAFKGCAGLTSIEIPNSVTSIESSAFSGCSGLTSVEIPNSVTSIGDYTFYECSGLTSVTIPNSVTSIGSGAFKGCTGLTSIEIPNSVTSIGNEAFRYCSSLTSVTIPDGVTDIESDTFFDCSGLTSVTIPNSVTSIGDRAFLDCSGLTSVTISNSVTSIGEYAFAYCSGLTSVTIPNSVTSIGEYAFVECSGLTSVTIPNSVTSIGEYAFENCSGLTSVTIIGNSVTSIGFGAFRYCGSLRSVTIGSGIQRINSYAFDECNNLNCITIYAKTVPQLEVGFLDIPDEYYVRITVYVPADMVQQYKTAAYWRNFANILPISGDAVNVTNTTVTTTTTTADIAWPQVNGAASYELVIKDKNGNVVCTLVFDAEGHLTSLTFNAPARNNAPQQTQTAGFSFTIIGLDSGTTYNYTITAKGNNGNVLKTESGTFTTAGALQGIEDVQSEQAQGSKILRDGQIFILRGEKTYTLTGTEVK